MKHCVRTIFGFHLSVFCIAVTIAILVSCVGEKGKPSGEASPEAAKQFLKLKGYEFNSKGFFSAVELNDLNSVNAFITARFDLNVKDSVTGRTALIMAAAAGDLPVVKALVEAGADVNAEDKG